MNYHEWEESVPAALRDDPLWRMEVYRLSLFASKIGWNDISKLASDRRTWGLSDQLCGALGSISANVAEGYSWGTGRDRAHFYEYALGSARETRDWYYDICSRPPEGKMCAKRVAPLCRIPYLRG